MKLSEKLIKLRKENGLSQEEFGNKINVSRQAVSKWENEEAKPDTDKIKEIVKKFNVSYEYLLNDEIVTMEETDKSSKKKHKMNSFLKVLLIILTIYLLTCVYKFITFYRFYLIANSFSEKNYSLMQSTIIDGKESTYFNMERVGNKILNNTYFYDDDAEIKDEYGNKMPNSIEYTDIDKREAYILSYDENDGKYHYNDRKEDMINDEEIEDLFKDINHVKENTLATIPSGFKEIFNYSINPLVYYVDITNRQFKWYSIKDNAGEMVMLSKDYLLDRIYIETKFGETMDVTYSYDYVQDHFKEIENPLEKYKDKIVFDE